MGSKGDPVGCAKAKVSLCNPWLSSIYKSDINGLPEAPYNVGPSDGKYATRVAYGHNIKVD